MVNLAGFRDLVDAFGGVTLNVRDRIPVGLPADSYFRYIEPGTRKLDGLETLWFARARYGSDDYSRMARQKCVMNAMLQQVSPQTALRNFAKIAKASSEMVSTSVPRSEVDRFVELALKAKGQQIATAVAGAAAGQHRRPRHRPGPREGRRGHRPRRGRGPAPAAGSAAGDRSAEAAQRPSTGAWIGACSGARHDAVGAALDDRRLARDAQGRVRRQRLRGPRGGLPIRPQAYGP